MYISRLSLQLKKELEKSFPVQAATLGIHLSYLGNGAYWHAEAGLFADVWFYADAHNNSVQLIMEYTPVVSFPYPLPQNRRFYQDVLNIEPRCPAVTVEYEIPDEIDVSASDLEGESDYDMLPDKYTCVLTDHVADRLYVLLSVPLADRDPSTAVKLLFEEARHFDAAICRAGEASKNQ